MSNRHELIYNQEDMDFVLEKLREAEKKVEEIQKEAEQSKQLLWAVVNEFGGEISIPYMAWLDLMPTKALLFWDDVQTHRLHIKTKEVENV